MSYVDDYEGWPFSVIRGSRSWNSTRGYYWVVWSNFLLLCPLVGYILLGYVIVDYSLLAIFMTWEYQYVLITSCCSVATDLTLIKCFSLSRSDSLVKCLSHCVWDGRNQDMVPVSSLYSVPREGHCHLWLTLNFSHVRVSGLRFFSSGSSDSCECLLDHALGTFRIS